MGLLLILAFGWFLMGLIGLLMLDRHGRQGEGFVWGVLLGPIGVLATVIIATNLDRERSDQQTRDLLRAGHLTREQEIKHAVLAALAAHFADKDIEERHASEFVCPTCRAGVDPRSVLCPHCRSEMLPIHRDGAPAALIAE